MVNTSSALYPIRKVSEMTGVNAGTLRAWERRYELIRPTRTEKGHRLYTPADVDRIYGILKLMDNGVAVSRVNEALAAGMMIGSSDIEETADSWAAYRATLLNAIIDFDDTMLEMTYNEVLSLYPHDLMARRLLMPLLEELGERWARTHTGIAEEHFFAVYLRNKLGARLHHRNAESHGPRLILACLPGERHEIGILLFALAASDHGFKSLVFGADMPLLELVNVTQHTSIAAIIVSSSIEPIENILDDQLAQLVKSTSCPIFAGGKLSHHFEERLLTMGITTLGNDIVTGIKRLHEHLSKEHNNKGKQNNG